MCVHSLIFRELNAIRLLTMVFIGILRIQHGLIPLITVVILHFLSAAFTIYVIVTVAATEVRVTVITVIVVGDIVAVVTVIALVRCTVLWFLCITCPSWVVIIIIVVKVFVPVGFRIFTPTGIVLIWII
mmetsp:Transcript_66721/g.193221  ORF Transcript_66721/g.193221 Transcript_66721/m.193221 type:complete len:129 (-) Transcript_66721:1795-2181(-)